MGMVMASAGVGFYYLAQDDGQRAGAKTSPQPQQAATHGPPKAALTEPDSQDATTVQAPPLIRPSVPSSEKPGPSASAENKPREEDTTAREAQVLARLNALRVRAGVKTVRLDRDLSRGCRDHARYLVRNALLPSKDGASPYWENLLLPGASEHGARVARSAWIDDRDPLAAIDRWAASPAHRTLLHSPRLQGIGLGMARARDREEWTTVFHLAMDRTSTAAGAVHYPADRQAGVPLAFPGNEVPDPVPDATDKVVGYPITVTFPPMTRVEKATFDLEDDRGKPVEAWFSSPVQPANKRFIFQQQNTICVMARKPFRPGSRYTVRVTARVEGKPWASTWSFVTLGHDEGRQEIESRVVARINAYRKASGLPAVSLDRDLARQCAAHAAYLAHNFGSHPGLSLRDEDPALPGYTEEGRRIARESLFRLFGGPDVAVDGTMTSILNRNLVLNPALTSVGVGFAPHPGLGYYWVFHLGGGRFSMPHSEPILFPAEDQREIPLAYPRSDRPSPIPAEAKKAGFAITALFPPGTLTGVRGRLTDKDGKQVDYWLHTPDSPLIQGAPPDMIGLLPKQVLAGGGAYQVSLAADINGKPWERQWTFHTVTNPEARQQELAAQVLVRLNVVRKAAGLSPVKLDADLSRACHLHARYLVTNSGHPALGGLGVHREDPNLPHATPEGAKAGKAAVICWAPDPLTCVDDWVSTFYHRIPLLSPQLKRIGFAALPRDEDDHWFSVLDSGSGK
jgi:uncharacterized protein YkwD